MDTLFYNWSVGDKFSYPNTGGFEVIEVDINDDEIWLIPLSGRTGKFGEVGTFKVGLRFLTGQLSTGVARLLPKRKVKITLIRKDSDAITSRSPSSDT